MYEVDKMEQESIRHEVSVLEDEAMAVIINNDEDYAKASEVGRKLKGVEARIKKFFAPMKENAFKTHKSICDTEKSYLKPVNDAINSIKKEISRYVEEKRQAEIKAEQEKQRLLQEALEKAKENDSEGAAEALKNVAIINTPLEQSQPKAEGITTSTDWELVSVNEDKVPDKVLGVVVRPVDKAALLRVIRDSKGNVNIPGVEFKQYQKVAIRK